VIRVIPPEGRIAVNGQDAGAGRVVFTALKPGFYQITCSSDTKSRSFIAQVNGGGIYDTSINLKAGERADTLIILSKNQKTERNKERRVFVECDYSHAWTGRDGQYGSGPYTEIMLHIPKAHLRTGIDYHWGVMDEFNYSDTGVFSLGGFAKLQYLIEDPSRIIRFAMGGNMGFYFFDSYNYDYNYYNDTSSSYGSSSYNSGYAVAFGGPSADLMIGHKPVYAKIGYALLFGSKTMQQFKVGIHFLF